MPNALAHVLVGAVAAVWLASSLPVGVEMRVACGLLVLGASLLPDIDHPKGTARKAYRAIGTVGGAILVFILLWSMGLNIMLAMVGGITGGLILASMSECIIPGHRGIVHSWKFAVAIVAVAYAIMLVLNVHDAAFLAAGLFTGYASHLILDAVA